MRDTIRSLGLRVYLRADRVNLENMQRALAASAPGGAMLDLGCGDGKNSIALRDAAKAGRLTGVERHVETAAAAKLLGVDVVEGDLDRALPFADGCFDTAVSNQVLEHLSDTDTFVAEIRRVLKPGGLAVVSTENLASWHNVAALFFGYAPFSTINYSDRVYPLGNPLSIHSGETLALHDGMVHRRIFTTTSLRALFAGHGFDVLSVSGAGYYPLPATFGRVDARHAHFITIAAKKPGA